MEHGARTLPAAHVSKTGNGRVQAGRDRWTPERLLFLDGVQPVAAASLLTGGPVRCV
jgi:hypothetical protein